MAPVNLEVWLLETLVTCYNCADESKEDIFLILEPNVLIVDLHGAVKPGEQAEEAHRNHRYNAAHSGNLQVH